MKKGVIKVMVGRGGKTRIQEDTGDEVKVYTADQWAVEQKKRAGEKKETKEAPKQAEKVELPDNSGIEEDTDETTEKQAEKPQPKPKTSRKTREGK